METPLQRKDGLGRMTFCLCMILALLGTTRAETVQESVELKYLEAEKILPTIEAMFEASASKGDTGKISLHAIAQSNSIVVSGSDKQRALVRSLVARFDQRPKQIYVSAVIAQVELDEKTPDAQHALRQVTEIDLGGKTIALKKYQRPGVGGSVFDVASAETGKAQRDTFLNGYIEALENLGNFSVIGRPFVFTGNNQAATISSGERIAIKGEDATITYEEELMSFEVTPVINPGNEVTLGIDLKLDFIPSSNTMEQRLKTTLRVAQRDLVILSTGAADSKDGKRYEHLVFLQPKLIDGILTLGDRSIDALLNVKDHSAPKAKPIVPRPARIEVEAEDNFLKRELKYLPVADALPIVTHAIARLSGTKFESAATPDQQSEDPSSILMGETLIISDPPFNILTVGPSEHVDLVDQLLDEIDVRPRQVFIETSIVEVTLSEDLEYGMDALKEGTFGRVKIGDKIEYGADILTQIESPDPDDKTEIVMASLRGGTASRVAIVDLEDLSGKAVEGGMKLYVSGLAAPSENLQVIAAPQLIATNNRQSIISPNKELEIRLLPLINSDDEVTLEVQTKCQFTVSDDNISTQALNTKVRMEDGNTIVLGGIIRKEDAEGERKELLIFIQPRIIPDKAEAEAIYQIPAPAETYESWAQKSLEGNSDFNADADRDGVPNGIEYIFGDLEITSPGPGQLTAPPAEIPADVSLALEASTDLQNWKEILRYDGSKQAQIADGLSIDDGIITDAREDAGSPDTLYYRYRASQR